MNNSKRFLVSALMLGAISQLNCGGCGGGGGIDGPPKTYDPPPSVDAVVEPKPSPVLSLALRGSTEPRLALGWPWLLQARVFHPAALGGATAPSFSVTGESAFTLELVNSSGAAVAAVFERVGAPLSGPTVIDASTELVLSWRLSAQEAAKLSAGRYSLRLALALSGEKVRSPAVDITLAAATDAGVHTPRIIAADDAIARGDLSAAEAEINAVLAAKPDHVQALARKGELRERAGDLQGAYDGFNAAVSAALRAEPGAPEGGPRHLFRRRADISKKLDGGIF